MSMVPTRRTRAANSVFVGVAILYVRSKSLKNYPNYAELRKKDDNQLILRNVNGL